MASPYSLLCPTTAVYDSRNSGKPIHTHCYVQQQQYMTEWKLWQAHTHCYAQQQQCLWLSGNYGKPTPTDMPNNDKVCDWVESMAMKYSLICPTTAVYDGVKTMVSPSILTAMSNNIIFKHKYEWKDFYATWVIEIHTLGTKLPYTQKWNFQPLHQITHSIKMKFIDA